MIFMKSILKLLTIILLPILGFSQAKEYKDFNKLYFCSNLNKPDNIPLESYNTLISKLTQIASNYGFGGTADCSSRFYITCSINIISKEITSTAPSNIIIKTSVLFSIGDNVENVVYSSFSKELNGIGQSEVKAYNNLISKINASEKGISNFIETAKIKIINYFDANCESIIKTANNLKAQGKYDEAIFELTKVPDISVACYENALNAVERIYQEKIDRECLVTLRRVNSIWSAFPNVDGARAASEIINQISPFSSCEPDLTLLLSEIKNKLTEDQSKDFELNIKKYNDAIELKREALRIDEEDRKRQSAIKRNEIKSEYALKKAELESEGGVINKIKKLKLVLWGENESSYLKEKGKTTPRN